VIKFARYVKLVSQAAEHITFVCRDNLLSLFQNSFPNIEIVNKADRTKKYDFQIFVPDLASFLSPTTDQVPFTNGYLKAPPLYTTKWKDKLDSLNGKKVGFAWCGNKSNPRDPLRSIPIEKFAKLFLKRDVQWVSLQVGRSQELTPFPSIHDWSSSIENFSDTAALIEQLDLVITVDNSCAHLAGALGKPVWVLIDKGADWRRQNQSSQSYWYDSMVVFEQETVGDWEGVLKQIIEKL
jgi:ADP-heptose:LPS heptosyltransferase